MPSRRIPKLFKDNQRNIEIMLANVHMDMLLCIHKVETEKKQPTSFNKRFIGTRNYLVKPPEAELTIREQEKLRTTDLEGQSDASSPVCIPSNGISRTGERSCNHLKFVPRLIHSQHCG
jgi:hypothetical protein